MAKTLKDIGRGLLVMGILISPVVGIMLLVSPYPTTSAIIFVPWLLVAAKGIGEGF